MDAAAGSIVAWGRREDQRRSATEVLLEVLRKAADLDGYAAHLERESREQAQENPLARKALGRVYLERREWAKAVN